MSAPAGLRTLSASDTPAAIGLRLAPGERPLDHLRRVIERARMEAQGRRFLVLTHRSPDPDALGAMAGVAFLLRRAFDIDPEVATVGRIFRAENLAMVRELALEFADYHALDPLRFAGALLVDSQPSFGHTLLPEGLPILAVFDHHQPPPAEFLVADRVAHYDIRLGLGSSSAMIYEYLRDAGIEIDSATATALCCGVRFDTVDLSVQVTALDQEAYFATFQRADRRMLARINRPTLPAVYYAELARSLSRARRKGPLVFGLLGRVANPGSVAEMADFFLRMDGASWSLVGGAYESTYYVSLRTALEQGEATPLLEQVLGEEGSCGGRGTVAGGQVQLASTDAGALSALERRLRARARVLARREQQGGSDPRFGTRLSRLT
jgi:nanoRNase/pAp phosphatase (c-di-AMP/oligoRNAs hydrolase)